MGDKKDDQHRLADEVETVRRITKLVDEHRSDGISARELLKLITDEIVDHIMRVGTTKTVTQGSGRTPLKG